jgi:hypothetical protein
MKLVDAIESIRRGRAAVKPSQRKGGPVRRIKSDLPI